MQDAREPLRRALLPPLRFAARNDYAGLERLKGFSQLVSRALADSAGLDDVTRGELEGIAAGFEAVPLQERRSRVERALQLLEGDAAIQVAHDAAVAAPRAAAPKAGAPKAAARPRARASAASSSALPHAVSATEDVLSLDVTVLKGIGPQKAELLRARGM